MGETDSEAAVRDSGREVGARTRRQPHSPGPLLQSTPMAVYSFFLIVFIK